jgi:hypothetical protein
MYCVHVCSHAHTAAHMSVGRQCSISKCIQYESKLSMASLFECWSASTRLLLGTLCPLAVQFAHRTMSMVQVCTIRAFNVSFNVSFSDISISITADQHALSSRALTLVVICVRLCCAAQVEPAALETMTLLRHLLAPTAGSSGSSSKPSPKTPPPIGLVLHIGDIRYTRFS